MLQFNTPRMSVREYSLDEGEADSKVMRRISAILSPNVVAHLPPHFQNIDNEFQARTWLGCVASESRLFFIEHSEGCELIGFLFVSSGDESVANIGYVLAENCWRQGLASELLQGFIAFCKREKLWHILLAGVDLNNEASSALLRKLGFVEQRLSESDADFNGMSIDTRFYEYTLS